MSHTVLFAQLDQLFGVRTNQTLVSLPHVSFGSPHESMVGNSPGESKSYPHSTGHAIRQLHVPLTGCDQDVGA